MQKFINAVQDLNGNAVTGGSVTVYTDSGHTTKATIYSDNSLTVAANPLTTDSNGVFSFYAANGRYYLQASKVGVLTQNFDDVLIFDPNDSSSTNTGAAYVSFVQPGAGPVTRTVQDALRAITRSGDFDTTGHFNTATTALTETIGVYALRVGGAPSVVTMVGPTGNNATVSRADITLNGTVDHVCYFGYNIAPDLATIPDATDMSIGMGFEASFNDGLGNLISEFHMDMAGPGASYVRPLYFQYYRTGAMTNKIYDVTIKSENTMSLQTPAGNLNFTSNGFVFTGAGPHCIGANTVNTACQVIQTGTFAGVGAGYGLYANTTLTAPVNGQCAQINIDTIINKAASGTHANFDGIVINAPTIGVGAAALTNATALRIVGAPATGTNKRALWVQAGLAQFDGTILVPSGSNSAPTLAVGASNNGIYSDAGSALSFSLGGTRIHEFTTSIHYIISDSGSIQMGVNQDANWFRDAAGVMAQKNGTNAQTLRIYGTTTGSKYASLAHDGTNATLDASSGQVILSSGTADIKWGKANVSLGGGAAPTVGTIGGSGPAAAAQRNWLRFIESDGTASFIPVWR